MTRLTIIDWMKSAERLYMVFQTIKAVIDCFRVIKLRQWIFVDRLWAIFNMVNRLII